MDCSIDSMSLFLPLEKINVLEPSLDLKVHSNVYAKQSLHFSEDGNQVHSETEFNPRVEADYQHTQTNSDGVELYTTYYKYQTINVWQSDRTTQTKQGFAISINSKLLHSSYLEGINSNTIEKIYDNLISQGVLSFSYETFLSSDVSDIDLKVDYMTTNFSQYTNKVFNNVNLHWKGVARIMKSKNKISGMQIFKRSHRSNPYFKLYNKKLELSTKSVAFANEYLQGQTIPDARVEITYCNSVALTKYGLLPPSSNRSLSQMLLTVNNYGMPAMSKVQREYIAMVLFGSSEPVNPDEIKGVLPVPSVMKKVDKFLSNHCLVKKGIPLAHALGIIATFTHKDHHRYLKNYIITHYAHYYCDPQLLKMRR